jgi:Icc-related predicted phosphoesterase
MRLIATSDTHFKVDISTIPDGDVFVHAGDLMTTGYQKEWEEQLEWLAQLPHKKKYYIPGNHDFHLVNYSGPALQDLRRVGVWCIGLPGNTNYDSVTLENGMTMLGLPYVKNLPRWCFNVDEDYMKQYLENKPKCDIVVSHSPIYKCLDGDGTFHAGFKAYRNYLLKHDPLIWICGHIHEAYGYERFQNTHVYNVAMCDRMYRHANPPLILDL